MLQKLYVLFANPNEWPPCVAQPQPQQQETTTQKEDVDDGGRFLLKPRLVGLSNRQAHTSPSLTRDFPSSFSFRKGFRLQPGAKMAINYCLFCNWNKWQSLE